MNRHKAIIIGSYENYDVKDGYYCITTKWDYDALLKINIDSPILKEGENLYLSEFKKIFKIFSVVRTHEENTIMYKIKNLWDAVYTDEFLELKERKEKEFLENKKAKEQLEKENEKEIKNLKETLLIKDFNKSILKDINKVIKCFAKTDKSIIEDDKFYYQIKEETAKFLNKEKIVNNKLKEVLGFDFYIHEMKISNFEIEYYIANKNFTYRELKNKIEELNNQINKIKSHWLYKIIERIVENK